MPAPQAGHWQRTRSPAPEVCFQPNGGKHSSLSLMKKEVRSDAADKLKHSGFHLRARSKPSIVDTMFFACLICILDVDKMRNF